MTGSRRRSWKVTAVAALVVAGVLAGCGGSSRPVDAKTLLKDTFSGSHRVTSGVLDLGLTITPTGSRLFTGPITFSLQGPFQNRGVGQLPASDLKLDISAGPLHGALSVISTGKSGYVTMSGQSYRLPQSTFKSLESGFAAATGTAGGSSSGAGGSRVIDPLNWLSDPRIVGREAIGGVQTTHVRAKVEVKQMLADLGGLLASAGSTVTGSGPSSLSQTQSAQLAKELGTPSLDVWTGTSDRTLRQLEVTFQLPVSGAASTSLGGMTSAKIALRMRYTDLNRQQKIVAPTSLKPYSLFTSKLASIVAGLSAAASSASGN